METKDLIMAAVLGVGTLANGGASVYENSRVADLEAQVQSLKIQTCLLINEVNRQSGNTELQRCGL